MKNYQNKAWLKGKYLDEKLSTLEIAKLCGLNSHVTILIWLNRFKIKRRTLSEAKALFHPRGMLGKHHSEETRRKIGRASRGRKLGPFSEEHRRHLSEAVKGRWLREKNPRWNNGATYAVYPPEFSTELREEIRKRDNYMCQYSGCKKVQGKKLLPVHHIDENPKNNDRSNLITYCRQHHKKVPEKGELRRL